MLAICRQTCQGACGGQTIPGSRGGPSLRHGSSMSLARGTSTSGRPHGRGTAGARVSQQACCVPVLCVASLAVGQTGSLNTGQHRPLGPEPGALTSLHWAPRTFLEGHLDPSSADCSSLAVPARPAPAALLGVIAAPRRCLMLHLQLAAMTGTLSTLSHHCNRRVLSGYTVQWLPHCSRQAIAAEAALAQSLLLV